MLFLRRQLVRTLSFAFGSSFIFGAEPTRHSGADSHTAKGLSSPCGGRCSRWDRWYGALKESAQVRLTLASVSMLLPRRECAEDYSLRTIARCTLIIGGLIAWTLFAGVLIGVCSAASPDTVFEVASVKRAAPLPQQQLFLRELTWEYMDPGFHLVHGRTLRLGSITLPQLIARAYRVRTRQVIVPKGFNSEKYDIEARLPEGAPKDGEYEMLKNLLADRFALRVHAETRNESGLQLVVRAGGSHLKAADPATKRKEGDVESLLARKREPMARGAGYFQSGH